MSLKLFFVLQFMIVMMVSCVIYQSRNQKKYKSNIVFMTSLCAAMMIAFGIHNLVLNKTAAELLYGFYLASYPLLLFSVHSYIRKIAGNYFSPLTNRLMRFYCIVLILLDFLLLLTNAYTHKAYSLTGVTASDGTFLYWQAENYPFVIFHYITSYFVVSFLLLSFIIRIIKLQRIFRKRYIYFLVMLVIGIILNGLYSLRIFSYDFCMILLPVLFIQITYYTVTTLPEEMITNLISLSGDEINCAIACFDIYGRCIFMNRFAKLLFRFGSTPEDAAREYVEKWQKNLPEDFNGYAKGSDVFVTEEKIHLFSSEYQELFDSKKRKSGCFIKLDDKTDEYLRIKNEKKKATHDKLTGVYNRETFFRKVSEELSRNADTSYYMICSDIENFKLVNDLFGSRVGDEILIEQARQFMRADYPGTVHGRISGDKFGMLIRKEYFKPEMAERNTLCIQQYAREYNFKLHMYLGIYEIANKYESVQAMCDKASMAIMKIHGSYEKVFAYYDMSILDSLVYKKSIIGEFRTALERGHFKMYLQPQISAKDEKVHGCEALVRWAHPEKGLMLPSQFVKILETTDYIYMMDEYIWELAAMTLSSWKKAGYKDCYISVNISAKDFYYADLYEKFTSLVEKYDISPKDMNLEVTETVLMNDVQFHQAVLQALKDFGFKIEMDDFGSGYSSLNTLKELSMDVMKLDMEFLAKTDDQERSRSIISTIIELAKSLGMEVVSEGVETKEQVDFLKEKGCDIFQGFYYSKALTVKDFEKKYLKGGSDAE